MTDVTSLYPGARIDTSVTSRLLNAPLVTFGAFFAVALGFAMQSIAQNFVAGFLLLTAVIFAVLVWSEDPWNARGTKSALNEAIWWAFKRAGIVIAYPQMHVHLLRAALARRGNAA